MLTEEIVKCYHSFGEFTSHINKKGEFKKWREGSSFKAQQYITIHWKGTILGSKYTTTVRLEIIYDPVRSTSTYQWRIIPVSDDSISSPSGDECGLNEWRTAEF